MTTGAGATPPGFQVERTSLAWQRAALAALLVGSANMVLAARTADMVFVLLSVGAMSLAAAACWRTVPRRVDRLDEANAAAQVLTSPFGRLLWSASAVVCLALACLVGLLRR